MIIAIDGPSGAGKTSVSIEVARRLGFARLDTGALYRGSALLAARSQLDFEDGPAVAELIDGCTMEFRRDGDNSVLFIDGIHVGDAIRTPEMSEGASRVSAQPEVRRALLDLQRRMGEATDCVVEGRDIGTVVFPDAEVKFFLHASIEERVRRRQVQYTDQGKRVDDVQMRKEVVERDERDSSRDVAPLKPADDAVDLDSTGLTFEAVVQTIVRRAQTQLNT